MILRAPRPADAADLTALLNLPGVRRGTARLPFEPEAAVLRRIEGEPNLHQVVAEAEGRAVGWASLRRHDGRRSHVGDVGLSVRDDHWGRGIGRALLAALLDLADDWLGLRRVELDVMEGNDRALALYERAGFEREGLARGAYVADGALVDAVLMARLRPAPERAVP